VFRRVSKENTQGGAWGKFVGCCGGHAGIASTSKNSKMVVGGRSGMEGAVGCRKGKGFSGESVDEVGRRVKGLDPVNRRETCLK